MKKIKIELSKFTLVGAANFMLTFIIFTSMVKVFQINYAISLIAASITGVLFTYILN